MNLKGKRFGRLKALHPVYIPKRNCKATGWTCICNCGKTVTVTTQCLRRGTTRSCGCLKREISAGRFTTHGKSKTIEFQRWKAMWRRCTNPNARQYRYYGARGIKVCQRWRHFPNFLSDIGLLADRSLTLERVNNNLGYGPNNCKWATWMEQFSNRRKPTCK